MRRGRVRRRRVHMLGWRRMRRRRVHGSGGRRLRRDAPVMIGVVRRGSGGELRRPEHGQGPLVRLPLVRGRGGGGGGGVPGHVDQRAGERFGVLFPALAARVRGVEVLVPRILAYETQRRVREKSALDRTGSFAGFCFASESEIDMKRGGVAYISCIRGPQGTRAPAPY